VPTLAPALDDDLVHAAPVRRRADRGPHRYFGRPLREDALRGFAAALASTTAHTTGTALTELLDAFGDGVDDDTAVLAVSASLATDER